MYNFHHSSINTLNIGSRIRPIDQKNSNTSDVIVLAAPFVISTNIIDPDVYIRAHEAAVSQRKNTWNSYIRTIPAKFPNIICVETPMIITFLGLMLKWIDKMIFNWKKKGLYVASQAQ